jgi:hypothetical protein
MSETRATNTIDGLEVEIPDKHPLDPGVIKPGDLMLFPYWARVVRVRPPGDLAVVVNVDTGEEFTVEGLPLMQAAGSADFVGEEREVTRTALEGILKVSINKPFTVLFVKQDGKERVLRGRYVAPAAAGRSLVEDLDLPHDAKGSRYRYVDHRTLKWFIVDGIRYTVKSR